MDTDFADAVLRLEEAVEQACTEASRVLTDKEIAKELRRIASRVEDAE